MTFCFFTEMTMSHLTADFKRLLDSVQVCTAKSDKRLWHANSTLSRWRRPGRRWTSVSSVLGCVLHHGTSRTLLAVFCAKYACWIGVRQSDYSDWLFSLASQCVRRSESNEREQMTKSRGHTKTAVLMLHNFICAFQYMYCIFSKCHCRLEWRRWLTVKGAIGDIGKC